MPTRRITILLAEDHTVVRQGLRTLLSAEPDFKIVAEAQTGREAITLASKFRPEVVLMDIAMPTVNGLEATRRILKAAPSTRVLALSAYGDDAYIDEVTAAGAAGYLLKQSSLADLAQAIRHVHAGGTFFSPVIARRLNSRGRKLSSGLADKTPHLAHLSARETEVLQLIANGAPNKFVAAELGISIKTVEKHRQRIAEKLQIHHIAGLTRYAVTAGIIGPGGRGTGA